MKITLYLTADKYLRHNEIITLPEELVELDIKRTMHSVGTLILSIKSSIGEKQYKLSDSPIDVTKFFLSPGEVNACVSLVIRGEVARTWQIEPFCVKEIPGGFEAIPEIEALKARIRILEKAVAETASLIEN